MLINVAYTPFLTLLYCGRARLKKWDATHVQTPYWRLYWNDQPGAVFYPADKSRVYYIAPPYFTLIAPNTILSRTLRRPVEQFFTHFLVGSPFDGVQNYVHRFRAPAALLETMQKFYTPTTIASPSSADPQRSAAALALCWYALATLPKRLVPNVVPDTRQQKLKTLLDWWEAENWRKVSNAELAQRFGMHPAAFCRYFHQALGYAPYAYGVMKRIERACLLLHFSNNTIEQIAEQVGFCDRYHFSKIFRRWRGVSPAVFRRQGIGYAAE